MSQPNLQTWQDYRDIPFSSPGLTIRTESFSSSESNDELYQTLTVSLNILYFLLLWHIINIRWRQETEKIRIPDL